MHLKRSASPRTWLINRKGGTFITRPSPGPHPASASLPLGLVLRDFLHLAPTLNEIKKLLHHQLVLVDHQRRSDPHFPVGLFDVLSFPELKEEFRLLLDPKGRLTLHKISLEESSLKPCKIIKKTLRPKKIQLSLHDGKNLLVERDFKARPGDTLLLTLPDLKIKEVFTPQKGALVFFTQGKWSGSSGQLLEFKKDLALFQKDGRKIETLKKYLFVLGDKKPAISLASAP